MAHITSAYYKTPIISMNLSKRKTKLKQTKCPNCGASIDIRKFVPDGYEVDRYGNKSAVFYERNCVKCDFCRSKFELCEEEK